MNIKPTEAMNWFITRTNPTAARTAAWSTMYGLIAVLTSLIAGVVVVAAAVATARASDGTDNSSPATLSGVGVAAALFGIFSAVLLFITAVAAFFAAYYAKHVSSILYITAAIHAFVCAVTVLTLLLTSLLAFIEANIARDAAVTVQMAVLCTLTSMVAFPFICLILGFISFTMFTTTAKPDND